MTKVGNLSYKYNSRTKRYTIIFNKTKELYEVLSLLLGKSTINYIMVKVSNNNFDVYDFFLLELKYGLDTIKSDYPELALKITGTALSDMLDFLNKHTWLADRISNKNKDIFNMSNITKNMKFGLLEHQKGIFEKYEDIKRYGNLRGFLMDAGVGAGKTFSSLALGEALEYNYVIIIAPKPTLQEVWIKSITETLYKTPQSYCLLGSDRNVYKKEKYLIFHYEYIEKIIDNKKLLRQLKKLSPMLIIDEFHNFNEIKSKRTQNLLKFVETVDFKDIALLTGTPIKMKVKELAPLLYIVDTKFPPIEDRFMNIYGQVSDKKKDMLRYRFGLYRERVETDTKMLPDIKVEEYKVEIPNGKDFTLDVINTAMRDYKEKRLNELMERMDIYQGEFDKILEQVTIKAIESGVSKTNINKIIRSYKSKVRIIRRHADKRALYKIPSIITEAREIEDNSILPFLDGVDKDRFKDIRSIIKYPQLKVLGEALGKVLMGKRIECYRTMAKEIKYKDIMALTDKKTIIFTNYISVAKNAIDKTMQEGYSPVGVYGELTSNLNETVKDFNDLKSKSNPIVATYKSLSTGVPLIAANIIICLDIPTRRYILEQALARAHRIGQDKDVLVFMIKLDTGDIFNITDRDLYIVNVSDFKVEYITGNKLNYEIPRQTLKADLEEEDEEEIIDELEEEIEEQVKGIVTKEIGIYDFNVKNMLTQFFNRFKFKL